MCSPLMWGSVWERWERGKCAAPLDGGRWLGMQGKAAGVSWVGGCEVGVPFLSLQQPHCVWGNWSPRALYPPFWLGPCAAQSLPLLPQQ